MQTQLGVNCPVFNDKSYSSLPGIEAGWGEGGWVRRYRRYLPQRENFVMLLGRQEEGRELFLLLLILNCLRLKIILMLKWRILGWHILNSFMSVAVGGSSRNGKFLSIKRSTLSHIFFFLDQIVFSMSLSTVFIFIIWFLKYWILPFLLYLYP